MVSPVVQSDATRATTVDRPTADTLPSINAPAWSRSHASRATVMGHRRAAGRPIIFEHLPQSLVGHDVEERRLAEMDRQRLPQRAVEVGIVGAVGDAADQEGMTLDRHDWTRRYHHQPPATMARIAASAPASQTRLAGADAR